MGDKEYISWPCNKTFNADYGFWHWFYRFTIKKFKKGKMVNFYTTKRFPESTNQLLG